MPNFLYIVVLIGGVFMMCYFLYLYQLAMAWSADKGHQLYYRYQYMKGKK